MRLDCACCRDMFLGEPFEDLVATQIGDSGISKYNDPYPRIWVYMESQCVLMIGFKSDLPAILERLGLFDPVFSYSGPWLISQKLDYSHYNMQWLELITTRIEANGKLFPWYRGALIFEGDNFFGLLAPKIGYEDD